MSSNQTLQSELDEMTPESAKPDLLTKLLQDVERIKQDNAPSQFGNRLASHIH